MFWDSLTSYQTDGWGTYGELGFDNIEWLAPGLCLFTFAALFGGVYIAFLLFRLVSKPWVPRWAIKVISVCCGGDPFRRGESSKSIARLLVVATLLCVAAILAIANHNFTVAADFTKLRVSQISTIWKQHVDKTRELASNFGSIATSMSSSSWCADGNVTDACRKFEVARSSFDTHLVASIAHDEDSFWHIENLGFNLLHYTCMALLIAAIVASLLSLFSLLKPTKRVLVHVLMWVFVSILLACSTITFSMMMQGISKSTCLSLNDDPIQSGFGTVFLRGCIDPKQGYAITQSSYDILNSGFNFVGEKTNSLAKIHFKRRTNYPTRQRPMPNTIAPTGGPTRVFFPTFSPSNQQYDTDGNPIYPTATPSPSTPTATPTSPSMRPTAAPTFNPSTNPTINPTFNPSTANPTQNPSTANPTQNPSTANPTQSPTTVNPTQNVSGFPSPMS